MTAPAVETTGPDAPTGKQVMVVGNIGTGKTTQFPTLKGRKFLYVFDSNCLPSIKAAGIDYKAFIPDYMDLDLSARTLKDPSKQKAIDASSVKGLNPQTYIEWERDFEARNQDKFFDGYDWVGLDSFTTFSDCVLDRIMFLNGRLGKHPEMADQTALMTVTKNVYRVLSGMNGFFSTAHTETYRDDLTGKVYGRIMMTGRNRIRIPLLLANIFATFVDVSKDGVQYKAKTVPDRDDPVVRTAIQGLAPVVDITIDFSKPLEGQGIGRILSGKVK